MTAPLTLLYDGNCPLCVSEMRQLARRDRAGRLAFVDIAARGFDPAPWGVRMDALMGRLHARRSDGSFLVGVAAIRAAYAAVGLGWLVAPTGWPGLRRAAEWLYLRFARNRMRASALLGLRCPSGACRREDGG